MLSRNSGNYTGLFNLETGKAIANLGDMQLFPFQIPNGNGLLPNDRTHVFKFSGSYRTGIGLTAAVLIMCWLATLRGAWLIGESGRRSAVVAWLRGFGATLRQPIRSLCTLALWAVPGFVLLVLPVLLESSAAWLALLPAWLASAFCWVALYLSFVPKKLPAKRTASPLDPPTFANKRFPTQS